MFHTIFMQTVNIRTIRERVHYRHPTPFVFSPYYKAEELKGLIVSEFPPFAETSSWDPFVAFFPNWDFIDCWTLYGSKNERTPCYSKLKKLVSGGQSKESCVHTDIHCFIFLYSKSTYEHQQSTEYPEGYTNIIGGEFVATISDQRIHKGRTYACS